jgi:hypothetical protein
MQVFGFDPFVAAILITAIGVALSVLFGWLKGSGAFNLRQAVASAMIAFIVSIQLVIAQLHVLPDDLTGLALGSIIFALIAQVSGIDSLAKSAAQAVSKARKSP